MIRARLRLDAANLKITRSLIQAVEPDNLRMKGLRVIGKASPNFVQFRMMFQGKIETFISTLDDMLACLQVAEKTLNKITRNLE